MKRINLKFLYPDHYQRNILIEVDDEIYKILRRKERITTIKQISCEKQSLELNDFVYRVYLNDRKEVLIGALKQLPLKQRNRIYEVYYLGLSKTEVALIEGCSEGAIRKSINRGLVQLKRKLKKYFSE